MFYVLFPTEAEAGPFIDALEGASAASFARRRSYTGSVSGRDVSAVVCGIGQANAAQAATSIIESGEPGLLVLGGCAGAFPGSGLDIGDVALATEEVYAGLGIGSPGGFTTLEEAGLPLHQHDGTRYYDAIPVPCARDIDLSGLSDADIKAKAGRFLTVTEVTGTSGAAHSLFSRYGALCENMEGAAAAQVALVYGAPFLELRGISNMVSDRDRGGWDIPLASANCAEAIRRIIVRWKP